MKLFVNHLTVMDFSYLHPVRGLLGESWQVDVELEGRMDDQGMILDFGDVKRQVKNIIDRQFDHKLLVPGDYGGLELEKVGSIESLIFTLDDGSFIRHAAPSEATTVINADQITTETVAHTIENALLELLPGNVRSIALHLYPEQIDGAWYQYSHGLKLHCGNCQRIAHGHRSRIQIYRNGKQDSALEKQWMNRFEDIYIAAREDLKQEFEIDQTRYFKFAYTAEQGEFELTLPKRYCYLMDRETTVENIAEHIVDELAESYPDDRFEVRAFEGVGKGAISTSLQGS